MTAVKVCGVTLEADARMLVELGVQVVGLNFWPESKRFVQMDRAVAIVSEIRSQGKTTEIAGVFVNASAHEMEDIRGELGLDWIQLHGDESLSVAKDMGPSCIKALPLSSADDLEAAYQFAEVRLLVDSHSAGRGGSGLLANWRLARELADTRDDLWLAGGLRADNVAAAVSTVRPYGVDLASGVESSPGIKERVLVQNFLAAMGEVT